MKHHQGNKRGAGTRGGKWACSAISSTSKIAEATMGLEGATLRTNVIRRVPWIDLGNGAQVQRPPGTLGTSGRMMYPAEYPRSPLRVSCSRQARP